MARAKNTKLLANIDCPGGGQVWVDGHIALCRRICASRPARPIFDVADPQHPKLIAQRRRAGGLAFAQGARRQRHHGRQSRETRARTATAEFGGGLGIYDVSKPAAAEARHQMAPHGKGVHRYDFDGRYAYISPTAEGYVGNIAMILDLKDPASRRRSGAGGFRGSGRPAARTIPGTTGRRRAAIIRCASATASMSAIGTTASTSSTSPTCRSRRLISGGNTSPAFPHPTHTCLPHAASRSRAARSWWWPMRMWPSSGRRHRPSPGSTTSPMSIADPHRDLPGAGPRQGRRAAAADDGLPPALGAL